MIPDRIKDLFQFIDFLHSNIEDFNKSNDLIKELSELGQKRSQLKQNESFKDKIEYDKIQNEISKKFDVLKQNVTLKIITKANDLKLLDNGRNANELSLSYKDVTTLKEMVKPEDLNTILERETKYLEFRKQTNKENYLSLGFFFSDLDEYIVDLFGFFSEDKNQFDFIRPTPIHLISGNSETKTRLQNSTADWRYFQIYFETENGKEKNNNSILTPENWKQHKDTFFNQRMETHPESYSQDEKIKLELEGLEKLTINKTDYKILKERYTTLLSQPKKAGKIKPNFEDFFKNVNSEQIELIKELINPLKGKELAIFISLAFNHFEILKLKSNSKDGFNQKTFIEMQGKTNQSVNKFLDRYFGFTGDTKDLEALEKQLNTILKDS